MTSSKNCSVALFYEKHSDHAPTDTIIKLLPLLKDLGFKSFCAEEPKGRKKQDLIGVHKGSLKFFEQIIAAKSIKDGAMQRFLKSGFVSIVDKAPEDKILQLAKEYAVSQILASKSYVELLTKLYTHGMSFCTMDMATDQRAALGVEYNGVKINVPKFNARNKHMKTEIEKACSKGNVFALVGLGHNDIANLLDKSYVNKTNQYYIASQLADPDQSSINNLDYKLRSCETKECKFLQENSNIKVIDLYENPTQDPVKIITQELTQPAGESENFTPDEL